MEQLNSSILEMKNKILPIFLIIILSFVYSCDKSTFSGEANSKVKKNTSSTSEIEIKTEDDPYEEKDPIIIDDTGLKICFEKPFKFPNMSTELTEVFNWHASGSSANESQVQATPVIGPLLGKKPSIIFPAFSNSNWPNGGGPLYAIDGSNGAQQWVSDIRVFVGSSPALGDIDLDGNNEVVVIGHDYFIHALSGVNGKEKWISNQGLGYHYENYQIALADINLDGKIEVISLGKVFKGEDGEMLFSVPEGDTIAFDVRDEKGVEVINKEGIYYGISGEPLCSFETPIFGIAAAKIKEEDSYVTIIGKNVSGTYGIYGNIIIGYRGDDCRKIFSLEFPDGGGGPFNIADFDNDGELEIGSAGLHYYAVFKANGNLIWKNPIDEDGGVTGSTTFDFNGDGKNEIIYNDWHKLYIFNGENGEIIYSAENSSGTNFEYPLVADSDADGHAEIIVAANTTGGSSHFGIRVLKDPENRWIGTRTIWNQYAYYVTNVMDDGRLVGFNSKNIWKKWIPKEYLLGFRNNLPIRPLKENCE